MKSVLPDREQKYETAKAFCIETETVSLRVLVLNDLKIIFTY